jgi:hypothetical protein
VAGLALSWLAVGKVASAQEPMAEAADPVASYTLRASLDAAKHEVHGEGRIRWRNASRVPVHEIWIHLYLNAFKDARTVFMRFPGATGFRGAGTPSAWGGITVERFAIHDGPDLWPSADKTSPGDAEDETDIRVPLPEAVSPGASVDFDVAFTSRLPGLSFRTGYVDGFTMVAQWFPKLARLEQDGRWAHFTFHHLSEFYADFGDYDVTVDTPAEMVVGATGKLDDEVRAGDRVARRFTQTSVHDFAFTAWSKFREFTAQGADKVAIRVLFPPGYEAAASAELETVRYGLDYFGRAYGRYPYPTLTVVHPPAAAVEAGGMEYPTLITTGGNWYLPWTGTRVLDLVTIHELGHQWFYGLVATDEHEHPFLDEGLNSYAEIDATEARMPHASAARWLDLSVGLDSVYRAFASDVERNAPIAQRAPAFATGRDYAQLVYERTETLFATLANVYGKDAVRGALGRYTRRHRFQHPGPEELLHVLGEELGEDAAAQARAALFDRATVDFTVAEIDSSPAGDGYRGSVLVRRRGALRFPVDVEMVGADGSVQRVRWDAKEIAARLPYTGKSELAAAVIDPDHRVLLDDDLGNNALRVRPARLSGGLLDRFTFAVQAALAAVLP